MNTPITPPTGVTYSAVADIGRLFEYPDGFYLVFRAGPDLSALPGGRGVAPVRLVKVESPTQPARRMLCSCCGAVSQGRQWHNRDTGFGLCLECADRLTPKYGPEEMQRLYGVRGWHYDISATMP